LTRRCPSLPVDAGGELEAQGDEIGHPSGHHLRLVVLRAIPSLHLDLHLARLRRKQGLQIVKAKPGEAILLLDDACAEPPQSSLLADALLLGGLIPISPGWLLFGVVRTPLK
jgi:hypothetical protein